MVAQEHLLAAGVTPEGKAIYELADGQPIEFEYGFARLAFLGEENVTRVIFGPAGIEPILGVVPLEMAGIFVDPKTQTLKRVHTRSLKRSRCPASAANVLNSPAARGRRLFLVA